MLTFKRILGEKRQASFLHLRAFLFSSFLSKEMEKIVHVEGATLNDVTQQAPSDTKVLTPSPWEDKEKYIGAIDAQQALVGRQSDNQRDSGILSNTEQIDFLNLLFSTTNVSCVCGVRAQEINNKAVFLKAWWLDC